jgi:MoaA/NifB/PqqE/SkfB family radical SAM enzyme
MLDGKKPAGCSYCWRIEATGNLSDRHYRSGEPWAAQAYTDITTKDPATWNVVPAYVEVNFSNVCNLRCSYCSPQFSSAWQKEINEHGAYPTSNKHNDPSYFSGERRIIPNREHNPYVEAFWRWWPDLYPQLKHFRMTGGEPLLDKNTYRVFDYVLENPKPDLHLNVTSNFSQSQEVFDRYLERVNAITANDCVEHFMQFVSLDSYGDRGKYIRDGLDFWQMRNNVYGYLSNPHRKSLTFIITMNNMNIVGLQDLLDWILDMRTIHNTDRQLIWFDTPILRQPAWQCLDIMPEAYAWKLQMIVNWMGEHLETQDNLYRGFKDYEVQRLQRVVDWMREHNREDKGMQADFYRFFTEHDKRRNTDFSKTFPEMAEWWAECKYWADHP